MDNTGPVHLITFYSDRKYRRAAVRLKRQALRSSIVSSVEIWNPKLIRKIAPERFEKLRILVKSNIQHNKGFGLWYWKPVIIEESLKRQKDGSILIYLDAGCYLNLENQVSISRMAHYIKLADTHGSLAMQLMDGEFGIEDLSEQSWTSEKVLDQLGLPSEYRLTNQIQAGIQFLKVNSANRIFASQWRDACERDNFANLIGDEIERSPLFASHRYDQSIFSCLYKIEKKHYIQDETYFDPDWKISGRDYPIWAIRNRDGIDPFEIKVRDLFARLLRKFKSYLKVKK